MTFCYFFIDKMYFKNMEISECLRVTKIYNTSIQRYLYPQSSVLLMLDIKFFTFKTHSESEVGERSAEFIFRRCAYSPSSFSGATSSTAWTDCTTEFSFAFI